MTDTLTKGIEEVSKLNRMRIFVGVLSKLDGHEAMIAHVMEYGAHIVPKNANYLTIPSEHVPRGKSARDFTDLHFMSHTPGKGVLVDESGTVMFYLVKSVDIPPRPYFRTTLANKFDSWSRQYAKQVDLILHGKQDSMGCMEHMGEIITRDIRLTMIKMKIPHNAPATIARKKGVDNPLVDTGRLVSSINYHIEVI